MFHCMCFEFHELCLFAEMIGGKVVVDIDSTAIGLVPMMTGIAMTTAVTRTVVVTTTEVDMMTEAMVAMTTVADIGMMTVIAVDEMISIAVAMIETEVMLSAYGARMFVNASVSV